VKIFATSDRTFDSGIHRRISPEVSQNIQHLQIIWSSVWKPIEILEVEFLKIFAHYPSLKSVSFCHIDGIIFDKNTLAYSRLILKSFELDCRERQQIMRLFNKIESAGYEILGRKGFQQLKEKLSEHLPWRFEILS
jgi:hypothetical protein